MNTLIIGLVGNPNCGKTTIFNALTGARQRVGNWPGVTVERKSGFFKYQDTKVEVVDLPGTYSLTMISEQASIDEKIACEYILSREADVIVNILDASNLERSLYLTLQLIEMCVPVILAVNMMDVAQQRGITIALEQLEKIIGCPIVALEANRGKGLKSLQKIIATNKKNITTLTIENNAALEKIRQEIIAEMPVTQIDSQWLATRLLENDLFVQQYVSAELLQKIPAYQAQIQRETQEDADILIADARYRFIQQTISKCITQTSKKQKTLTAYIDHVVLNRVLGVPIFLSIMYLMFVFAINVGGAFQDFFDISSNTIFVGGLETLLLKCHTPHWLIAILANGVGKGINTTVTFIPVIGAMFLFLALLEDSGYMARAAFVIDRVMRALGLPGKSFVPMIVGFGCNVPAVMAARTLENKRDRILTIMMSPFMSCGARLAIFAVFVAAFFPTGGQNIIFSLYLLGIAAAVLTGFILRKTLLQGEPAPLLMELPAYHVPTFKTVGLHAWQRLKGFLFRAGKLIVPICMLLGMLNSLTLSGAINDGDGDVNSLLSWLGRAVTPIFTPMGVTQDNWPATVGLLTGVLAKEVVVGVLNALYSQIGHVAALQASGFDFWGGLHDAVVSIPANLSQLGGALGNPVLAVAPINSLPQSVYGLMYQKFGGQIGALAYLIFVLLYFPCISTTAAMVRELNRGWAIFSLVWSTGFAYCVAVAFYQAATLLQHPFSSLLWLIAIAMALTITFVAIRYFAQHELERGRYEFARN